MVQGDPDFYVNLGNNIVLIAQMYKRVQQTARHAIHISQTSPMNFQPHSIQHRALI
jgi:hypothetical protein